MLISPSVGLSTICFSWTNAIPSPLACCQPPPSLQDILLLSTFQWFISKSSIKGWKRVPFSMFMNDKDRAIDLLSIFSKVTPQVWRTELGLAQVLPDSPHLGGVLGLTASLQDNITCRQGQMLPVTLTIHHAQKKVQREIFKNSSYAGS